MGRHAAGPRRLALALCALALGTGCARQPVRPNVLLITVDTLRADRMSCYGYERLTTPALDRLAAEGLRFTRVTSPRAKTTPALASLMTGLYPHDHGVRDLSTPIGDEPELLAEAFRRGGYATFAAIGNWVLIRRRAGLDRGFATWVEDLPERTGVPPDTVPQRTARSLTDGALVALGLAEPDPRADAGPFEAAVRPGDPWFCWLHYMDPHGLYDPPAEHDVFRTGAIDAVPPLEAIPRSELHRPQLAAYNVPPDARLMDGGVDAALVRDRYDGEVHYADHEIGRLLDALRAEDVLDDTLVVVTADHGESLGEHLYWFEHGLYTYEVTTHVPLIVRLHEAARVERRSGVLGRNVSLVDLAPTLLDLCDLPPLGHPRVELGDPKLVGRSFAGELDSPLERFRPVFAEQVERSELAGLVHKKSVRQGDHKLIRRYTWRSPFRLADPDPEREMTVLLEELYDLAHDPYEERNLLEGGALAPSSTDEDAAMLERLRESMDEFFAADRNLAREAARLQRRREALEQEEPQDLRYLDLLGYGGE